MPSNTVYDNDTMASLQAFVRALGPPVKYWPIEFDKECVGARWIWVGATAPGNLSFVDWNGQSHILPNMTPGREYFITYTKINSSGTDFQEDELLGAS